jgi:hypothetical protein
MLYFLFIFFTSRVLKLHEIVFDRLGQFLVTVFHIFEVIFIFQFVKDLKMFIIVKEKNKSAAAGRCVLSSPRGSRVQASEMRETGMRGSATKLVDLISRTQVFCHFLCALNEKGIR